MGLLVKSPTVRQAARPRLKAALEAPASADAAGEADNAAAQVEEASRAVSVNIPVLAAAVAFAAFVIAAGIYTEQNEVTGWAERLAELFGAFVPGLVGYFAGEFVAEKTK